MSKLFAFFLMVFCITASAALGMNIVNFVDIPSLLLVVGVSIGVIVARHGFVGLKLLFDSEHNLTILPSLGFGASFAAIIANLFAFAVILTNLGDAKSIGPAMAVAVLSSLYCILLNLLVFCLNAKYQIKTEAGVMLLLPLLLSGLLYIASFSVLAS